MQHLRVWALPAGSLIWLTKHLIVLGTRYHIALPYLFFFSSSSSTVSVCGVSSHATWCLKAAGSNIFGQGDRSTLHPETHHSRKLDVNSIHRISLQGKWFYYLISGRSGASNPREGFLSLFFPWQIGSLPRRLPWSSLNSLKLRFSVRGESSPWNQEMLRRARSWRDEGGNFRINRLRRTLWRLTASWNICLNIGHVVFFWVLWGASVECASVCLWQQADDEEEER